MKMLGADIESKIDWSAPRLLCIARDFNQYDEHAVQQIDRNIELIRYRHYESGFFVLELASATTGSSVVPTENGVGSLTKSRAPYKGFAEYYERAPQTLKDLFDSMERFLLGLGDDVTRKDLKYYAAFRRIKNFVCAEVQPQGHVLLLYLKVDPSTVELRDGFVRDVTNIGHYGTGDLEVRVTSLEQLESVQPLLVRSYEES